MIPTKPSLIVCTHNPRADYLGRVLEGCAGQRGLPSGMEILAVDSASTPRLAEVLPKAYKDRTVRSEVPGLAIARALGIRECAGDPVVFVDDDTLLNSNYVAEAVRILSERPYLAAIGGQLLPDFEGPLPLDESYYRTYLAIREFDEVRWSNRWDDFETSPIGGGMVVRRSLADAWADRAEKSPWRLALGRTGRILSGGEDIDLLHLACEMGYGKGIFPELRLTHLMPATRLTPEFLLKIYEGNCRSGAYLSAMLNPEFRLPHLRLRHRLRILIEGLAKHSLDRKFHFAAERGRWAGWRQAVQDKRGG
jgi:glycosyltransferase involved in cell wall biosynthesis